MQVYNKTIYKLAFFLVPYYKNILSLNKDYIKNVNYMIFFLIKNLMKFLKIKIS